MDFFRSKLNHFVIEQPQVKKNTVRSFISKPNKNLEKKLGRLFGLFEIEDSSQKVSQLTEIIIEEFKNSYYDPRIKIGELRSEDLESLFEKSLQRVNQIIISYLETQHLELDLAKVSLTLGVIADRHIIFSPVGSTNVYLFQFISTKNDFRIIDVIEASQTPTYNINPLKIFSQVVVGRVNPRDIVVVCTPNILDFFSLDKIKHILTQTDLLDGLANLKRLLLEARQRQNFGLLTIEVEKSIEIEQKRATFVTEVNTSQEISQDSMQELIKTQRETEKLLAPSLLPELKRYTKAVNSAFLLYLNKIKGSQKNITKKIILPKIKTPQITSNLKFVNNIGTLVHYTFQFLLNKSNALWLYFKKNIPAVRIPALQKIFSNILNNYQKLPKSSRILLAVAIIISVFFIQSVVWLNIKNNKEEAIEKFNRAILGAEMKKNESEASLIFRDENKARELLVSAKKLLIEQKPSSKTQKMQVAVLQQDIEKQLEKIRHMVVVDEPIQIVNFRNLDNDAKIAPFIVRIADNIYTQNQRNKIIYKANLATRVISSIVSEKMPLIDFYFASSLNAKEILFLTADRKYALFDRNSESPKDFAADLSEVANISDAVNFGGKLYLLDSKTPQIFRFAKSGNSLKKEVNWVEEDIPELKKAVSLCIDGFLYALDSDGKILKLQKGKKVDFSQPYIEPALASPNKIKTLENSNYLYFIDPPSKRIIVVNKNGQFTAQYYSKNFIDLKDIIIAEQEKKIYVLDGSSVYAIAITHLE